MSTRSFPDGGHDRIELPDVLPFTVPRLTRLSWELGTRVVEDDDSVLHSEWERRGTSWTLSVFRVTSTTVVMRVCTPAGRRRFYGAAQSDLQSALPDLDVAPRWQRRD